MTFLNALQNRRWRFARLVAAFGAALLVPTAGARIEVRVLNMDLPFLYSEPFGISSDGSKIGVHIEGTTCLYDWTSGKYVSITRPTGSTSLQGVAVSGDGRTVIGTAMINEVDDGGVTRSRRRIWRSVNGAQAVFIPIDAAFPNYRCFDVSADGNLIVGAFYNTSNAFQGSFRFNVTTGEYFNLRPPDGWSGGAVHLSNDGAIAAGSVVQGDISRAAVWPEGSHVPELLPTGEYPFEGVGCLSGDGRFVAGQGPVADLGYTAFIYDRSINAFLPPSVFGQIRPDSLRQIELVEAGAGAFVAVGADQSMTPARWESPGSAIDLFTLFHQRVPQCSDWWWMTVLAMSHDGRFALGQRGAIGAQGSAWVADLACLADMDGDTFLTGADFDRYVHAFEAGESSADFDYDGFITGVDFDLYVQAFEAGC